MKKEIKVEIIKKEYPKLQFYCNLSPEEIKVFQNEIELEYLDDLGDWTIELYNKKYSPVPCSTKKGYWLYTALF